MKYQKYNSISDRKEWKNITSKIPTDEINQIWGTLYPLKVSEIKFLATLIEYDQKDISNKFLYYRSLSPNIQKGNSLENYILKYGETIGRDKYQTKNKNSSNTLDRLIERHGVEIGKSKHEKFREGRRNPKKLMIKKYGEDEGIKRYNNYCERNRGNHSLERKLEMYPEEEAHFRYNNFIESARKRYTLEGCIEIYGVVEGTEKYRDKIQKLHFGASELGFKEKYGSEYKEILRKSKDNTSLDSFIIRYGEIEGTLKYKDHCDGISYRNSLQYYIDQFGKELGKSKFLEKRSNTYCKFGVSPISQELFEGIRHEGREYYHNINHEYFLITKYGYFYIDYVNKDKMKAVEFNGDVFHANPEMFLKDDRPNPYDKTKTSEDIWKYDEIKINAMKEHGFDVLVIWEKDYRENKQKEINRVNEFIYG
jgi:hypothetical protein